LKYSPSGYSLSCSVKSCCLLVINAYKYWIQKFEMRKMAPTNKKSEQLDGTGPSRRYICRKSQAAKFLVSNICLLHSEKVKNLKHLKQSITLNNKCAQSVYKLYRATVKRSYLIAQYGLSCQYACAAHNEIIMRRLPRTGQN
jgi:hypothetical protein